MKIKNFIFLMLIGGLISCAKQATHAVTKTKNRDSAEHIIQSSVAKEEITPKDSILFLFFETDFDSAENTPLIYLKKLKKVAGRTKFEFDHYSSGAESFLNVAFLDDNKNTIKQGVVENPFKKKIEFLGDNGKYQWATVVEKEFVIKTNFNEMYKFIRFTNEELTTEISLFSNTK